MMKFGMQFGEFNFVELKRLLEADLSLHLPLVVYKGDKESVTFLLERGIDIDMQNTFGDTALNIAARNEYNIEIATMLLVKGADPSIPNHGGLFIPDIAPDIIGYYIHHMDTPHSGYTPFMTAIRFGNYLLQEHLLEYEVDFSRVTACGNTLLTMAISYHAPEHIVEELINRGADLYHQTSNGNILSLCISAKNVCLFKKLWNLVDYKEVWKHKFSIIVHCLENMQHEIFEYIIESDKVKDVVDLASETTQEQTVSYILNEFYCDYNKDKIEKAICILLTYGYELTETEMCDIYDIFGYSAFFEFTLHLNIRPCMVTSDELIPMICCHPTVSVDEMIDSYLQKFCLRFRQSSVETITKFIVCERLYDRIVKCYPFIDIELEKKMKKLKVPSLIELGRNAARIGICRKYEIKKNSEFYTVLNFLPLPRIIKDIIKFKQPIY